MSWPEREEKVVGKERRARKGEGDGEVLKNQEEREVVKAGEIKGRTCVAKNNQGRRGRGV